jgi:hypothetical protein
MVIGMNPSTAEAEINDPTIAKLTRMAMRWRNRRFGGLFVGNIHAYRATDQTRLAEVADPIGPENDRHLMAMAKGSEMVVFAYGDPKVRHLRYRGPAVVQMMRAAGIQPHVLRIGPRGVPWHPLYLLDSTEPTPWTV